MDLKKLQLLGDKYSKHFKEVAKDIVMDEVTGTDDENREVIAMFTARDMAIGAILKRKEYMLTGVTIGVLGTCLTIGVINKIKERRNTKDERLSTEELEKMGIKTFKVKSFETKSFDI